MPAEVRAGVVRVDIGGDSSRFTGELRKSGEAVRAYGRRVSRLEGQARRMNRTLRSGVRRVASYQGALGALATAGVVTALARRHAALGAEIQETSEQLGISAERWQQLGQIFKADGTEANQLRRGLTRVNRALVEAGQGNLIYRRAFRQLNIDTDRFIRQGGDTYDLLRLISREIQNIPNQSERIAIFTQLFDSRIGGQFLVTLQRGLEYFDEQALRAREVGIITDENAARLKALDQTFTDFGETLGASLGNAIGANLDDIQELVEALRLRLPSAIDTAATGGSFLVRHFDTIALSLAGLIGVRGAFGLVRFIDLLVTLPVRAAGVAGVLGGIGLGIAGIATAIQAVRAEERRAGYDPATLGREPGLRFSGAPTPEQVRAAAARVRSALGPGDRLSASIGRGFPGAAGGPGEPFDFIPSPVDGRRFLNDLRDQYQEWARITSEHRTRLDRFQADVQSRLTGIVLTWRKRGAGSMRATSRPTPMSRGRGSPGRSRRRTRSGSRKRTSARRTRWR